MTKEALVFFSTLFVGIGIAGVISGAAVLTKANRNKDKVNTSFDVGVWLLQVVFTFTSGAFVTCIVLGLMGVKIQIGPVITALMFVGSVLSLFNSAVLGARLTVVRSSTK